MGGFCFEIDPLYSVKAKQHFSSYQRTSNTDQEKPEGSRIKKVGGKCLSDFLNAFYLTFKAATQQTM